MKWLKHISLVLVVLFILALITAFVLVKGFNTYWYSPLKSLSAEQVISVEPGTGFGQLVARLHSQGIWRWPRVTSWWLRVNKPDFVLKAGEFRLPANATPAQIIDILDRGVAIQYKVTLIEGDNARQMLARLTANEKHKLSHATSPIDLNSLLSEQARAKMVDVPANVAAMAEGWFLPDTYFYSDGDSLESLLLRAHQAILSALEEEWAAREEGLPYQSAYQALIMASLIEKETGVGYERPQIAGVFVRRLQKRMRLQTDPTVIYGMGERYTGNLRRADLKRDTLYNTYTRHGLPPTPIAMPGRASIHAALHPLKGSSLYFVAKGDGSHYFSTTLEEHQAAVKKYQLNRRADYRSAPAAGH